MQVEADPLAGGVRVKSFITCEDVRAVAKERLSRRWGMVSGRTLAAVDDLLRILLRLWGADPVSVQPIRLIISEAS